jgi:cytochrome c553
VVRAAATAAAVVAISLAAVVRAAEPGATLFSPCAACHLPTGKGVPGVFPNLTDRLGPLVAEVAGRKYLVLVVQAGLVGPLAVDGVTYNGVMPLQGVGRSDENLAALLNFVIERFNGKTAPRSWKKFTAGEVGGIRADNAKLTARDVAALRPASLGGQLGVPDVAQSRQDWILNCQGCHRADALTRSGGAPTLAGSVSGFLAIPAGRDYLVRVPGVAFAPLPDDRLAALLNWTVQTYDRRNLPSQFLPYTAGEVRRLRERPLIMSSVTYRRGLLERLHRERAKAPGSG